MCLGSSVEKDHGNKYSIARQMSWLQIVDRKHARSKIMQVIQMAFENALLICVFCYANTQHNETILYCLKERKTKFMDCFVAILLIITVIFDYYVHWHNNG